MVPDEVEPAEGRGGLAHDAAGRVVAREIGGDPLGLSARRLDLGDDRLHALRIDIDDPDGGTFRGEAESAGAPDARGCGRDDADLVCQSH